MKPFKRKPDPRNHAPAALTDGKVPAWFKAKHHYTAPIRDGDKETVVLFLINMNATTHSGYLVESSNKHDTFAHPTLANSLDKAMTWEVQPYRIQDMTLRVARYLPKYYYPVFLLKRECYRWTKRWVAERPDKHGEIKYF